MTAPDTMEAAVHENSRNAAQNTPLMRAQNGRYAPVIGHDAARRMLSRVIGDVGLGMFVTGSGEVRLTNQTGHPAAVVQYDFGVRDPEGENQVAQPLTTTLIGDLFADDKAAAKAGVSHTIELTDKYLVLAEAHTTTGPTAADGRNFVRQFGLITPKDFPGFYTQGKHIVGAGNNIHDPFVNDGLCLTGILRAQA